MMHGHAQIGQNIPRPIKLLYQPRVRRWTIPLVFWIERVSERWRRGIEGYGDMSGRKPIYGAQQRLNQAIHGAAIRVRASVANRPTMPSLEHIRQRIHQKRERFSVRSEPMRATAATIHLPAARAPSLWQPVGIATRTAQIIPVSPNNHACPQKRGSLMWTLPYGTRVVHCIPPPETVPV